MGFVLAYLLPALPLIYWIAGLMGYLSFFVEVLFALPLWLVAFVRSQDGAQKFVPQEAKKGMMILFHFISRPSLMLVGLVVGMAIMNILGWFADMITMSSLQRAYGATILGVVSAVAVYMAIFTMIIWRSMD